MSDIYVFGPSESDNDYSTMGLVGVLVPTNCEFSETANGDSIITLEHPLDDYGRYAALSKGNILAVSVPVRLTPEIHNDKIVTTIWSYKVKPHNQLTHVYQRTLFRYATGTKRVAILNEGDVVTVVEKPEGDNVRWKVKTSYGDGWILPEGFELVTQHIIPDNSSSIEVSQSSWKLKRQYFRIQDAAKSLDKVKVTARHITYDLLTNMTEYKSTASVTLPTVLNEIMSNCYASHNFEALTNIINEQSGLDYTLTNPIDAFLNPETGICSKFAVSIIRDNYSIYFLKDPGVNRDVRIQYRKNMLGISFNDSDESVVTRVIPIGETKDGKNLYLSDDKQKRCVDSPLIANYPVIRVAELKCENCKVGDNDQNGGTISVEVARQRMLKQANDYFVNGNDKPKIDMSVEFVNLGDTEEYSQFKGLENCFTYDYIVVQHPDLNIDVTAQIMQITWDVLTDRMKSVQIGSVGKTLANTGITSWQIPSGFSGSKIASETIGSSALKSDIISARHVQSDSINTDALQANSITSEKIKAGSITSESIKSGTIETVSLEAYTSKIEKLTASDIKTDRLAAALATFTVLTAGSAEFDRATIAHLVSNAMNLEFGTAGNVFIKNLAVQYGQMVEATIGNLCIKASDGNYYLLDVTPEGNVSAEKVAASDSEISSGQMSNGSIIIETNITASNLNSSNILSTYALINQIDAARINVDQLFAREAFVDLLRTTKIVNDKSIEMIVGDYTVGSKNYRSEHMPTSEEGPVKPGDIWVIPSTGEIYQAESALEYSLGFYLGDDGSLYYSMENAPDSFTVETIGYDLYSNNIHVDILEDGTIGDPYVWIRVRDREIVDEISNIRDVADGKTTIFYDETTPSEAVKNDIWFSKEGTIYKFNGDKWIDITSDTLKAALNAAGDAKALADKKVVTFAQSSAPVATSIGDLWIDTDDNNMLYRWDGTIWRPYRDKLIETVKDQAEFATVHDSTTPPIKATVGKLWLDRSLTPAVLRRWTGAISDSTDVDGWEIVNDVSLIEKVQDALLAKQKEIAAEQAKTALYLTLDDSLKAVRIGQAGVTSEYRIDAFGAGVVINGQMFSRHEANRFLVGDMEMRRPSVGGLAFDATVR